MLMISRFSSNTEIPVPSKVMRWGSFHDLNLKKTEDDMLMIENRVNGQDNFQYARVKTRDSGPRMRRLCRLRSIVRVMVLWVNMKVKNLKS